MLRYSLETTSSPHSFFFSIFLFFSGSDCNWWQWEITESKTPKEEKFSWFKVWCLVLIWEILSYCVSNIYFVPFSLFFLLLVFPLHISYTSYSCSTVLGYCVALFCFVFQSLFCFLLDF